MKKLLSIWLPAVMLIMSMACANAEDFTLTMQIDNPIMTVNGTESEIDEGRGTTPVIVNDRTLVPIRAVIEAMGGSVEWNADTQTVTLDYGDDEIILVIDSASAQLNGVECELDAAPTIINERTMLPIRFIAEGFSFDVDWTQETQTVTIRKTDDNAAKSEATAKPNAASEPDAAVDSVDEPASADEIEQTESKMLVAYFSNTGNTESIAEYIAEITGADLFEIVPEEPYTEEDLNYSDSSTRATVEQGDPSLRPAIAGTVENMDQYDTVYIGYPIWWGDAPRIISTFLESYDFSDKSIIPFCTSGSSGIGSSAEDLHSLAADAEWLDGRRFAGGASQESVAEWIASLDIEE